MPCAILPGMSDSQAARTVQDSDLTAKDVIAWLERHPGFLREHPQALEALIPPASARGRGAIADFQHYMIERLKADKGALEDITREIVENSRANMNNQHRIHRAVLLLLEAENLDDFIHTITMDLSALLDVDIAALVVETDGRRIPHVGTSGVRIVPSGTVDKWMAGKPALMQSDITGIEAIYGGAATLVASQILLRVDISMKTPPAILAFGSRDPKMFEPGQATDQISFLTRVVERCFRMWLDLPGRG